MSDLVPTSRLTEYRQRLVAEGHCMATRDDGDCSWAECPQLRDGEPHATGRHCPRDTMNDED